MYQTVLIALVLTNCAGLGIYIAYTLQVYRSEIELIGSLGVIYSSLSGFPNFVCILPTNIYIWVLSGASWAPTDGLWAWLGPTRPVAEV